MKNDYFWLVPFFFVSLFLFFFFIFIGTQVEEKRIYDKCMETNKTMIHQEAVKLCKEIVK